jgi:hypothetical protein
MKICANSDKCKASYCSHKEPHKEIGACRDACSNDPIGIAGSQCIDHVYPKKPTLQVSVQKSRQPQLKCEKAEICPTKACPHREIHHECASSCPLSGGICKPIVSLEMMICENGHICPDPCFCSKPHPLHSMGCSCTSKTGIKGSDCVSLSQHPRLAEYANAKMKLEELQTQMRIMDQNVEKLIAEIRESESAVTQAFKGIVDADKKDNHEE